MENADPSLSGNFYPEEDLNNLEDLVDLSALPSSCFNSDIEQQALEETGISGNRDDHNLSILNFPLPIEETITGHQWANGDLEQQTLDQTAISGNIPTRDAFLGPFNFQLSIDEAMSGQQWVYSNKLQKLFIGMNKNLLMQFRMNLEWGGQSPRLYIVALPVYSTDEHVSIPVNRCTFHSVEDDPQGQAHQQENNCLCNSSNNFVGHVVRAGEGAQYIFDNRSRRHSVRVLVTPPQPGCDHIPISYSFACKTSCPRGMQRRPIHVIFTLEDELGQVFGRQKIEVKICSCPKRDKKRQELDESEKRVGGQKRKRPLTDDPVSEVMSEVMCAETYLNSSSAIKLEEDNEPRYMQEGDAVVELKREISDVKKLFSVVKDAVTTIENKINRISELNERLHF